MLINFTEEEWEQCSNFAEQIDTSFYSSRNQENDSKRKKDQLVGKLGEIAVFKALKEKHPTLSSPDFKIFKSKDKSWDFDMKGDGINLHVKSQEIKTSKKFGESWTFQKDDREIFGKSRENQYVAFAIVDLQEKCSTIKAVVELDFLFKKDLFKDPILLKLRESNKAVVYYRDMKDFTTKLWVL